MKRFLLALSLVLGFSASVSAQTPCTANCVVPRGTAFTLIANWAVTPADSDPATGFKLYQNNIVARDVPVSALVAGSISFPFPAGLIANGTYTFVVAAYNAGGETPSDPFILTIQAKKPAATTNTRVTVP